MESPAALAFLRFELVRSFDSLRTEPETSPIRLDRDGRKNWFDFSPVKGRIERNLIRLHAGNLVMQPFSPDRQLIFVIVNRESLQLAWLRAPVARPGILNYILIVGIVKSNSTLLHFSALEVDAGVYWLLFHDLPLRRLISVYSHEILVFLERHR